MSDEAREARNKYLREWRKANKEATRAHQVAFWEKRAAQAAQKEETRTGKGAGGLNDERR